MQISIEFLNTMPQKTSADPHQMSVSIVGTGNAKECEWLADIVTKAIREELTAFAKGQGFFRKPNRDSRTLDTKEQ